MVSCNLHHMSSLLRCVLAVLLTMVIWCAEQVPSASHPLPKCEPSKCEYTYKCKVNSTSLASCRYDIL